MRHGKKINHLGRTDSHRKAMLSNMASSLILHKRITTTLAKAKALRTYVEPLITKSKNDTTHSRRTVFSYLKDKNTTGLLFREIAEKVAGRPGGYTRIVKLENRSGDNAEMAIIELVDYNLVYTKEDGQVAKKSTRRRGGSGKGKAADAMLTESQVKATPANLSEEPAASERTEDTATEEQAGTIMESTPEVAAETQETPADESFSPLEAPADETSPSPETNEENAEKGE